MYDRRGVPWKVHWSQMRRSRPERCGRGSLICCLGPGTAHGTLTRARGEAGDNVQAKAARYLMQHALRPMNMHWLPRVPILGLPLVTLFLQ
jgi:hypothetical protein